MGSGAHVDPLTRHSPALRSTGRISYLVDTPVVSGKLDVALGLKVNQYKLCVLSLSPLNSLILVCIFVIWYKQPIKYDTLIYIIKRIKYYLIILTFYSKFSFVHIHYDFSSFQKRSAENQRNLLIFLHVQDKKKSIGNINLSIFIRTSSTTP